MAHHPISLPCALALPTPSHRNATTPSPCWPLIFMTQECLMFWKPTLSEPRLSSAATMSDDILSALTPPLLCASILQPATPPPVVAFESWTISTPICLNQVTLDESRKPDFWTCVRVVTFKFASIAFAFLINMNLSFKSLVVLTTAIPLLLSPQHSFLAISKMLNHSDTCVVPTVCHCNAVGLLISPVFTFLQQLMTKGLWVIYTCTWSPRISIDVIVSAPDDPCICW